MRVVPLASTPNQAFTATLDGARWVVRVLTITGATVVDLARDGVQLLSGSRAVAGEPLIPYRYMETGNFIFLTQGDEMPEWSAPQTLVYLSPAEVAAARANPLTPSDILPSEVSYLTSDDGFYLTSDTGELLTDD